MVGRRHHMRPGVDQATTNVVARLGLAPASIVVPYDGAVATLSGSNANFLSIKEEKLVTATGGFPAAIHQYDRNPSIRDFVYATYDGPKRGKAGDKSRDSQLQKKFRVAFGLQGPGEDRRLGRCAPESNRLRGERAGTSRHDRRSADVSVVRSCVMGIAISLQQYLDGRSVPFDVTVHELTHCSSETARVSSIPEDNLAKGVLLRREDGYLLAVVPASYRVELEALSNWLDEPIVLASEAEASTIFGDCELGSVPPVAGAYDLMAVIDDSLQAPQDVYFEGGDHCTLVHLDGGDFRQLMRDVPHGHIATRSSA
jgi:Ala-tRNA(Pro) deacylase